MHERNLGEIKLTPRYFSREQREEVLGILRERYEAESKGDSLDAMISRLMLATYPHYCEWLWSEAEKGIEPAKVLTAVKSLSVALLATTIDSLLPPIPNVKVSAVELMVRQIQEGLVARLFEQGPDIMVRGEKRQ